MDTMDDFKGLSDKVFLDFFRVDLFSRSELDQYFYPHEIYQEFDVLDFHTEHCKKILYSFILESVFESGWVKDFEIKEKDAFKLREKIWQGIQDDLENIINEYLAIVKIKPINLENAGL